MGDITDVSIISAHATNHKSAGSDSIKIDELAAPTDVTTLNATTGAHGLLPKLGGGTVNYLRADGTWAAPPGGAAHASTHQAGGSDPIKLDDLAATDDNTDLNSTTAKHGLLPKLGGGSTNYLRADGTWNAPPGGGAHAATHAAGGGDTVKLDDLGAPDDNTDLDASTAKHGLLPKLGGGTTNFLRADGTWAEPAGGGGSAAPYVYDNFPATYAINQDDVLSPDLKWRCQYRGRRPDQPADVGQVGVRVPGAPTNGFARVFYEYPYAQTYTGSGTSASLVTTETAYYTDFDVTLYLRTIDQRKSTPNSWETAWIFFRYNEAHGELYHHYALILKANGNIQLSKKDNTIQDDAQEVYYNTEPSFTFAFNAWNKLRIRAEGNHIQVWVDDVLKIDAIDDAANAGDWDYTAAPDTPTDPSINMYSGLIGLYNEDAEVEFGPMTITEIGSSISAVTTYSNGGAGHDGVGVVLSKDGSNLPFKDIAPASEKIQVIDNTVTNSVEIDVVESQLDKDNMKGGILARSVALQDVVNTITETTIFEAIVPANKMGIDKFLRFVLNCDYLCNSGTNRFFTIKIIFGVTTIYQDAVNTVTVNAARRPIRLVGELAEMGVTNAQSLGGYWILGDAGGATAGIGDIADDEIDAGGHNPLGGTAAEDTTVDKTFKVTVTHSAAEANVSFRRQYGYLEIV